MKKLILLALVIFLIFLLTSCTVHEQDISGFPLTYDEIIQNYDYFISVEDCFNESSLIKIIWTSSLEPVDYAFTLGGLQINDLVWVIEEIQGNERNANFWVCNRYLEKDSLEIINNSVEFLVEFNGKFHQGELRLNPELTCDSFIEFHFDIDLDIDWEAAFHPQLYNLSLYQNWFGDQGYGNEQFYFQINGSVTSYTLDYLDYSHESGGNYESLDALIKAVSYFREKKFLIYSFTNIEVTYDNMVGNNGSNCKMIKENPVSNLK